MLLAAVSEFALFLGQLQGLALPFVEALRVGPVHVGASDTVERGDSVTRTSAGRGALSVCDRDPCVGVACGSVGPGERAGESGLCHRGLLSAS
jgi:hypothetical protein